MKHRDTPLNSNSLGSLVIALPCAHAGGTLVVRHRSETEKFDFAKDMENDPRKSYEVSNADNESKGWYKARYYSCYGGQPYYGAATGLAKSCVSWAAFYGDAEHEIEQVTRGARITLSYQLYRGSDSAAAAEQELKPEAAQIKNQDESQGNPAEPSATAAEDSTAEDAAKYNKMTVPHLKELCRARGLKVGGTKPGLVARLLDTGSSVGAVSAGSVPKEFMQDEVAYKKAQQLVAAFRDVLSCEKFYSSGCRLGFPCFHLYERDEDLPSDQALDSTLTTEKLRLRGADALLATTAARLGLTVHIMRIVILDDGGDGLLYPVDILPTPKNYRFLGQTEIIEDCFRGFGITTDQERGRSTKLKFNTDEVEWVFGVDKYISGTVDGPIPLAQIAHPYMSCTGYFGNEASEGTVYSQVTYMHLVYMYFSPIID